MMMDDIMSDGLFIFLFIILMLIAVGGVATIGSSEGVEDSLTNRRISKQEEDV
jgi:hypothetical protein